MSKKQNCWEYKKCEIGPFGKKVSVLGQCPASYNEKFNTINNGKNAGRACWAIIGTVCNENSQESQSSKIKKCLKCDFYNLVMKEEKENYTSTIGIMDFLK